MKKEEIKENYLKWVENQTHLIEMMEDNDILDILFNMKSQLRYELFHDIYNGGQDFPSLMELAGHLHYCEIDDGELNLTATYIGPTSRTITLPNGETKTYAIPGCMTDFFIAHGEYISEEYARKISNFHLWERHDADSSGEFSYKSKYIPIRKLIELIHKLNEKQIIAEAYSEANNKDYFKTRDEMRDIVENMLESLS